MTMDGMVFRIKKYALHDGPGIRTTVFFKGCPLRCWWCHNPEGQGFEPESMPLTTDGNPVGGPAEIIGRPWTVPELVAEIEKDRIFYDESGGGTTFSGGEPLAQPEFLDALLEECRRREIHTTVDTSGYAPPEVIRTVLAKADLVLYDLKLMDDARHRRYTGVGNQRILANLETLDGRAPRIVIRFPLVPGVNDEEDEIRRMAQFVAGLKTVHRIDLLPFHPIADGKYRRMKMENRMAGVKSPTRREAEKLGALFAATGLEVRYGG
ncbi:MAG: glycyl-radical enzyme activating protein [Desulfobacterales bacterium]|nr:glycyl-radical enzyme activating protein [Desulfobacteraceae bacterium]MDY0312258.1 glycyl-radical enzyme activating protein [Desulfobacterales bacterium]